MFWNWSGVSGYMCRIKIIVNKNQAVSLTILYK